MAGDDRTVATINRLSGLVAEVAIDRLIVAVATSRFPIVTMGEMDRRSLAKGDRPD